MRRQRGGEHVGTWDVGPFDNDSAADWCADLRDADPAERVAMLRGTLTAVVEEGDAYLDHDFAAEGIAAAAIIAAWLPGGPPVTSAYASAISAGEVPADLPPLAVRVLDRVTGENSEWRELWGESPEMYDQALAALRPLRAALERAAR